MREEEVRRIDPTQNVKLHEIKKAGALHIVKIIAVIIEMYTMQTLSITLYEQKLWSSDKEPHLLHFHCVCVCVRARAHTHTQCAEGTGEWWGASGCEQ